MSFVRFNHVFAFLMLLSLISAFVVPQRTTDKIAAHFRTLFAPVAWPLHRIASSIYYRMADPYAADTRDEVDIRVENAYLRTELVRMARQLEALVELNNYLDQLKHLRHYSQPLEVVGSDSNRDALILRPLTRLRIANDLPVIYPFGIVGRLDRVGGGASPKVRLITDKGFRLVGAFGRFVEGTEGPRFERLASPPHLVEGAGQGTMVIRNVTDRQAKEMGLQLGDWVVLEDRDWPEDLHGQKIGHIVKIQPRPDAPHHLLIELQPTQNLKMLRTVMVFDRQLHTGGSTAQ